MADADDKKPLGGHSLNDHLYGENIVHEHDEYSDHDHDHFEFDADGPIEQNPIWLQDHVTLVSVGIDIGSAGTQVIFSRINLRRYGEDLTSRYYVVSRETLYQSPNALTPYSSEERIDDAALGRIIDEAYAAANLHPDKIDTGAVILTGEALRRENAEGIAKILSEQGGEFVGGTTKLGVVEQGHVIATAAVHIGGRLQVVDASGRIERLDPAGRYHARQAGFDWHKGDVIDLGDLDKVAETMADELVTALTRRPIPQA